MKCILCNERKGSTRCEGCDAVLCLPCMNKHHDELMQQYQQLMDIRNELKQSLDTAEITSQNEKKLSCLIEIDRWERASIERIREISTKARAHNNEMVGNNVAEIRYQLEQLSVTMQQQQKEGNYLENDIEGVKSQLNQLQEAIRHINEKIQVTTSNNVDWDSLIRVIAGKTIAEDHSNPSEYFIQRSNNQNKSQINQEKQSMNNNRSTKQSTFRPTAPLSLESDDCKSFRPISPPAFQQNNSSDSQLTSTRTSPLIQNVVSPDTAVPMLPTQGQPFSWTIVARNRPNT